MPFRALASCAAIAAVAALAAPASASELIGRNATGVELRVDRAGYALLSYTAGGTRKHVLAWGAANAIAPTRSRPQVSFTLDYSGGWGTFRRPYWKTFRNACSRYDGPPLHWLVAACKAPDGSYWAVQSWQRALPNYGRVPSPAQAVWELRLSHWTGELPALTIKLGWAYRRFDHLFGRFTYRGHPVFGFESTQQGRPLDTFGRNLFVDTYNSAYGRGWRRENSFLTHTRDGVFCYGFFPHGQRPAGSGTAYRATIAGPGVAPDVVWQASAPGPYDRARDLALNEEQRRLGDRLCRPN